LIHIQLQRTGFTGSSLIFPAVPPKGSGVHPYVVTLFALNVEKIDLSEKTTLAEFNKALEGKTITTAKLTGMYER
jgi:phosphatidylethanolamine-binding protein (PEBP) family uncharacterized protein